MTLPPPVVFVVLEARQAAAAVSVLRAYLHRPPFGDAATGDDDHLETVGAALGAITEGLEDAQAVGAIPRPAVWPGLSPGGLWRVIVDADGRILEQGPLHEGVDADDPGIVRGIEAIANRGSALIFDGDSGDLVARLHRRA